MSIISKLTEKPWLSAPDSTAQLHDGREFPLPPARIGLRVFLGVVTVVFLLFSAAYIDRTTFSDWRPLTEPWLLWLNTGALILGSAAMHWARVGAQRGQASAVANGLHAGGVFTTAFLVGQVLVWWQLAGMGYVKATNPASAFFYLLSAAHALHILGGMVAWARTMAKVWRGLDVETVRVSVELCSTYWHFLLLIWLVLFGLLLLT